MSQSQDQVVVVQVPDWMQGAIPSSPVTVQGYTYQVDLGAEVRPRYHTVHKDRSCDCGLGKDCPAVGVVAEYLRNGGQRAPDPRPDFWPKVPEACPVCGGPAIADWALNSRRHGCGWRCLGEASHYWEMRARALIAAQRRAYAATPDYVGLPGVGRQTAEERAAWLQAHRLDYAAWA
jgi:hypothetical protein